MAPVAQRRFGVMGTRADVLVVGRRAVSLAAEAEDLLIDLERRWSRFEPSSEISRLNRRETTIVSSPTFDLIAKAMEGRARTGGRFDPTLLTTLVDLGYDRSFERLAAESAAARSVRCGGTGGERGLVERRGADRADGPCPVRLDLGRSAVELAPGVAFDPGGIGKGLAADIVSEDVMQRGADGVLINLGGDLRVRGVPPRGDRWIVAIREPALGDDALATLELVEGAVATSTVLRRRWPGADGPNHHLIDPRTGAPTTGPLLASVVAGAGWWAEVAATALMTATTSPNTTEPGPDLPSTAALVVEPGRGAGHSVHRIGPFADYERTADADADAEREPEPVGSER